MITVAEIREYAAKWHLPEETIEKDYVLGWMLWGISREPQLTNHWLFKGGTCLKKCFIETYRFSEDLDFTVTEGTLSLPQDLLTVLKDVLGAVSYESGIDLLSEPPRLKIRAGGHSAEGRIYYIGPRRTPTAASIKLDLTVQERVVLPHTYRDIHHAYSDTLPQPCQVRCYAFEEVFAEKIRAMGERCRPRDLYDIVNLYRHEKLRPLASSVYDTLREKCKFKGISVPTPAALGSSPFRVELGTEWVNMLAHQLPALPPLDAFWSELSDLFGWLEGEPRPALLPPIPISPGDNLWLPTSTRTDLFQNIAIDTIRFAGLNRLCLEFRYRGEQQLIEPYALHQTLNGSLLLQAWHTSTKQIKTYPMEDMEKIQVTNQAFSPKYRIELVDIV